LNALLSAETEKVDGHLQNPHQLSNCNKSNYNPRRFLYNTEKSRRFPHYSSTTEFSH